MKLSDLQNGQRGTILRIHGRGPFRKRISEMGFVRGKTVFVIKNAPLRDPIEYRLMGYNISLRRSEAALIDVDPVENSARTDPIADSAGSPRRLHARRHAGVRGRHTHGARRRHGSGRGRARRRDDGRTISVALVGNPNSGKTTLFNNASGSREHVGNYCGVTICATEARFTHGGYTFTITDLPGTYSISAYTPEELFVRDHLVGQRPDVIINVIDASNLERNLYLTTQLIDMGHTVVVAFTMSDEIRKRGDLFDHEMLGKMLGIPFVPTVGPTGEGVEDLFDTVAAVFEGRDRTVRQVAINYGRDIENAIATLDQVIAETGGLSFSSRFAAIKLLEKDADMTDRIASVPGGDGIIAAAGRLVRDIEAVMKEDSQTLISDARYGFIAGALRETLRPSRRPPGLTTSDRIDRFLTHQVYGFPLFLFFMWATFQLTFTLGQYPMDWIDSGVTWLSGFVAAAMSPGLLRELISDGIIAGVGGVIVFLPNILILFFMISLMEDTGYMARAAFIMDRLMHAMGLHGKSFIPLLMGFGCNVPAIMATRTLESRKDRILTMMIIPFMSCSARLPVFVLLIGAFFSAYAGTLLFALYLTGIVFAVLSALLLKKTIFRSAEAPFVMELPPYRAPHFRNTLRHMWGRALEYLKKIGGIVLVAAILIWALGRFPYGSEKAAAHENRVAAVTAAYAAEARTLAPADAAGRRSLQTRMAEEIRILEHERDRTRLEGSVIGHAGRFIEPVVRPLGFDWKMGVSLLTGLAAKEISVSTLGVLYHTGAGSGEGSGIVEALKKERYESGPKKGLPVFDPPTALGFMLFMLLYVPCLATLVAMKKESGSWKWPIISALYSTAVAWLAAFLIRHAGLLLG